VTGNAFRLEERRYKKANGNPVRLFQSRHNRPVKSAAGIGRRRVADSQTEPQWGERNPTLLSQTVKAIAR
jgi:hypothetical protein